MVGWSEEFPAGDVRPLRYFGQDLVAYRGDDGALHVLDAHCRHLGAHIGHGGKVEGDCVRCPFHGWVWGPDGVNREIPYDDRPNLSQRLGAWPVQEQHECVFLWHDPKGGLPRWDMPDIFGTFPQFETDPDAYYRAYPELSRRSEREPVHPQQVAENGADIAHFRYVHHATVLPVSLDWRIVDREWHFIAGYPNTRTNDPDDMVLRFHSHMFGLGGAVSALEGSADHRLIFAVTPVEDGYSDMFYSIWLPRRPGDDAPAAPADVREPIEKEFLTTMEDDLEIWRYQEYVDRPAMAKSDAKAFSELRKWVQQFYEV
jgi:phenylpropionate dioxygenase-like ring-hydroxylating dioxygenase large terminal subunit